MANLLKLYIKYPEIAPGWLRTTVDLVREFWDWLETFPEWPDWQRAITGWWWSACLVGGAITGWALARLVFG